MSTSLQLLNLAELRYDRNLSGIRQSTVMSVGGTRSVLPELGDDLKVWTGSLRTAGGLTNSGATLDLMTGDILLDGEVIAEAAASYDADPYFLITAAADGFEGNNIEFSLDDALLGADGWSPSRQYRITVSEATDGVTTLIRYNPATDAGTLAYEHCSAYDNIIVTGDAELTLSVVLYEGSRTSEYSFAVVEDETPAEWISNMVNAINASTNSHFYALFIPPNEFKVVMRRPETTVSGITLTTAGLPSISFEVAQGTNLGVGPAPIDTWGDVASRINAHAGASALVSMSTSSSGTTVGFTYSACRLSGGVGVAVVTSTPFFASGEPLTEVPNTYNVLGYSMSVTPNPGSGPYKADVNFAIGEASHTLATAKGGLRSDNQSMYEPQSVHYLNPSPVTTYGIIIGDAIGATRARFLIELPLVANLSNGDYVTLNGTTVTLCDTGTPGIIEAAIGADMLETLGNLAAKFEELATGVNLVVDGTTYLEAVADEPGTAGNNLNVTAYFSAGGGHSGTDLQGGADYTDVPPRELDVTITWAVYYSLIP